MKHSLFKTCHLFKLVILSEAKDLLFAGQSPNHSREEQSEN